MTTVVEQFVVALIVLTAAVYAGWVLLRPLWARRSQRSGCSGCAGGAARPGASGGRS